MVDITHKTNTLRQATARAIVKVSSQKTIDAIVNKTVPKGDVFEMAKTAGLFAVKRTSDMIPDCHPLPIEFTAVRYEIKNMEVFIEMEVKTIYKTGVEVEAMHGVSVVALTMYDMLKPIDKGIEISTIKLLNKKGGKSDLKIDGQNLKAAVLVVSDSVSAKKSEDLSGKHIVEKLKGLNFTSVDYYIVSDEIAEIQNAIKKCCATGIDLIISTGGTGLSLRDVTPEAVKPLLEKEIAGIMETSRNYGQDRTPYAMLSRGLAGFIGKTLVLTLPGSVKGVTESMQALFPQVLHVFKVREGAKHE
ncbi:MAG TPA: bifunctional molybdenum cofactor biosynthesis protein MoaC/MoaB [Bacteroidia bacterium]|jgi:cyclic pyranopterin phosphate synthase|nr:bifunctional molybdenum cofactor biosynthesis protein MoaC/MoaB [Bacteroidia bacterium]